MVTDIEKRLGMIENRLDKIEQIVFQKNRKTQHQSASNYQGLSGGIRLLIDNKFFNQLRSLTEIDKDLRRENYHYSLASIAKILATDFTKRQKILNRIKEGKIWKYVIRK